MGLKMNSIITLDDARRIAKRTIRLIEDLKVEAKKWKKAQALALILEDEETVKLLSPEQYAKLKAEYDQNKDAKGTLADEADKKPAKDIFHGEKCQSKHSEFIHWDIQTGLRTGCGYENAWGELTRGCLFDIIKQIQTEFKSLRDMFNPATCVWSCNYLSPFDLEWSFCFRWKKDHNRRNRRAPIDRYLGDTFTEFCREAQ